MDRKFGKSDGLYTKKYDRSIKNIHALRSENPEYEYNTKIDGFESVSGSQLS